MSIKPPTFSLVQIYQNKHQFSHIFQHFFIVMCTSVVYNRRMAKNKVVQEDGKVMSKKEYILEHISFWLLSFFSIIIPIFFLPLPGSDFLFAKMALFTVMVLVVLSVTIFNIIKNGSVQLPKWQHLVLISIVPLFTVISSIFSVSQSSSFIGIGNEFDTAHFIGLGFLLIVLVAINFQSKQKVFFTLIGITGFFSILSIFHIVRFIFGADILSFGDLFSSAVANTVGTWNDLGIYAGLVTIISFMTLEFVDLGKKMKWFFYGALGLSLIMLLETNFYVLKSSISVPLVAIVGIVALLIFVYFLNHNYKKTKKLPLASLIVLIFCVIMTIGASSIASFANQKAGIIGSDIADVRPTMSGTYTIAKNLITQSGVPRALIGVGPNRFSTAWALFRPAEVNQTVFWNTDFNYGIGYILTTVVTLGILGFVAWLVFLGILFWKGLKSIFKDERDRFSMYIIESTLFISIYLWLVAFFSTPSTTILTLAFFFTGLLIAAFIREKNITLIEVNWTNHHKKGTFAVIVLIVLFVGVVAWAFVWSQRYIASIEVRKASLLLKGPENVLKAQTLVLSALNRAPQSDYFKAFSQLKLIELQILFQKNGDNKLTDDAKNILAQAISAAEEARRINPTDYHNLIFLGQTYQTAGVLGIEGAGDASLATYKEAASYIPTSPIPMYFAANLFYLAKDLKSAQTLLEQALKLKPDFEEARTLYEQLKNSNGQLEEGAQSLSLSEEEKTSVKEKATSTAPLSNKTKR